MTLHEVTSTNLQAVGYDTESRVLRILFHTGASYDYRAVPETIYTQLLGAQSAGIFFQERINKKFEYTKTNLEKERIEMKKQSAKKQAQPQPSTQPVVQATVQVAPAPSTPAPAQVTVQPAPAPSTASRQDETIARLKAGWEEKGVDLSKLQVKQDGKFLLLAVDDSWPVIQVGASGGIVLPQLRSYAKAYDAAMTGKELFAKQNERDKKKSAATSAPAPAVKVSPAQQAV